MRINSSLDEKSKPPGKSKSASDSRYCSRAKRRGPVEEPQQTDSTIATVTLYIGQSADGEGVKIVKNAAASDVIVDCADIVDSDSRSLEDLQQEIKPTYRKGHFSTNRTPILSDKCRTRRKSKERYSPTKSGRNNIAVYDLSDLANLPTEVFDILSCKGGALCFHDHDRLRVINNKVFVYKKDNNPCKYQSKKRSSPFKQSPRLYIDAKKVTFSPAKKRHSPSKPSKARLRRMKSSCHKVPAPPTGYHIRIDPSSPDSCHVNSASDDSTWTQTNRETASNLSTTLKDETTDSIAKSQCKKQCLSRKETKELVKKALGTTAGRFDRMPKCKIKKRNFHSDNIASPDEVKRKQYCIQLKSVSHACGDCGDTVWKDSSVRNNSFDNQKRNIYIGEEQAHLRKKICDEESCSNIKLESMGFTKSKRYLKQTVWVDKDASINNNSYPDSGILSDRSHRCTATDETPGFPSDLSNSFHLLNFNTNMNAMSFIDNDPENTTDDIQEGSLEQNLSSTTPSVDQFYTPDMVTSGGVPEATGEVTPAECVEELSERHLEGDSPMMASQPFGSPENMVFETQEEEVHVESGQECWESKKRSIMMACNEAIKNRLKRQEIEEEESKDITESKELTSSESASANTSHEKRKKRKTKTTESVYLKFKTSLSKKMTTTTTVKEVKQSPFGTSGRAVVVESDHQNTLSLSSQCSEKSFTVPQPRHTRIVKCGEAESHLRKRKLSSDTEVQFVHLTETNRQNIGVSKDLKDGFIRDPHICKKENPHGETHMIEVHCVDTDRHDVSPHQNLSLGTGELIGECDKLTDKASAITVINTADKSNDDKKMQETLSHHTKQEKFSQKETELDEDNNLSVAATESFTQEAASSIEKAKEKNKSSKRDKKKSALKKMASKTKKSFEKSLVCELPQGPQSETSLAHSSKNVSSSKPTATYPNARSHSSPPQSRKKKAVLKKKTSVSLLQPSETESKGGHKARKKSSGRRKVTKNSVSKGEEKPRTAISTSSANSEKKRKSQTTASSISIDSAEDVQHSSDKILSEQAPLQSYMSLRKSSPDFKSSSSQEDIQTQSDRKEIQDEIDNRNILPQEKFFGENEEVRPADINVASEGKISKDILQQDENISKLKELPQQFPTETIGVSKIAKKSTIKTMNSRPFPNKQTKEKDLQQAENGWNGSCFYHTEGKTSEAEPKAKHKSRRPKLKYVLVKAKDKNKDQDESTAKKAQAKRIEETKSSYEAPNDQTVKPVRPVNNSQRGQVKIVQFLENTEDMEITEQAKIAEEVEPDEEQAQETHTGDIFIDVSIGDMAMADNFDLAQGLVEEEATGEKKQPEQQEPNSKVKPVALPIRQKKLNRRPMWLKKTKKPQGDHVALEIEAISSKQNLSPKRLEKKKESFEEIILKSDKCNIQVTNPLQPTVVCPKGEKSNLKTRVAYSAMLNDVFRSIPVKKGARHVIAESGSPVDIKEVIEGSSVDAVDYAKSLRYSPNTKRIPAVSPAGLGSRRGYVEQRSLSPPEVLLGSGSARSILSRDSDAATILTVPSCSFSTDIDEAPAFRKAQARRLRKKDLRTVSSRQALPWYWVDGGRNNDNPVTQLSYLRVSGDMAEPGILNTGLSWLMQEFFSRFDFLNPRRNLRPLSLRQGSDLSTDPNYQDQRMSATR